jgi:aminocarboxymuconate-semialdehyde decarboxylase
MGAVVDVHAHMLVPDALLLGNQERIPPLTPNRLRRLVDLDSRLSTMDAAGVDVQAVSVVPWQIHHHAGRPLAGELVTAVNQEVAGLVRRAPDRLVGVGTVALQYPELAAEQLRRAVDDYDFRGVQIADSAGGRDLTDPALTPFWTIAQSLGVPVFVHPRGSGLRSQRAFDGVLDRFPELALCAAHGCLPRSGRRAEPDGDRNDQLPRMYVDVPVGRDETVGHLDPHRLLLGSGYPFGPDGRPPPLDTLSHDDREAVRVGNARTLLRLDSLVGPA